MFPMDIIGSLGRCSFELFWFTFRVRWKTKIADEQFHLPPRYQLTEENSDVQCVIYVYLFFYTCILDSGQPSEIRISAISILIQFSFGGKTERTIRTAELVPGMLVCTFVASIHFCAQ